MQCVNNGVTIIEATNNKRNNMSITTHIRVDIATNKILSYVAKEEGVLKKEVIKRLVFDKYKDVAMKLLEEK